MNCREAHHAILAAQDRALSWRERVALRLHLAICLACRNFRAQMMLLRRASRSLGQLE